MSTVPTRATPDDLMRTEGKAELIGGKVVEFIATGMRPNEVAGNIYVSLRTHSCKHRGKAFTDNMGYIVPELLSGRESFSPDTSYYDGPFPANVMKFISGPPTLGVEVRSENDYGAFAESEIAAKRHDYFEAGTKVVWDVDPRAETIDCYRSDAPDTAVRFTKNDFADAEPAVPGWRISGAEVFA